jgi:hypothetical protein
MAGTWHATDALNEGGGRRLCFLMRIVLCQDGEREPSSETAPRGKTGY